MGRGMCKATLIRGWVFAIVILIAGCSGGRSLVGTWQGAASLQGREMKFKITMSKDGRFLEENSMDPAGGVGFKFTAKGTWSLNGDLFSQTAEDIDYEFYGPPAVVSGATEKFRANRANQLQERNSRLPMRVKWIDDDTYVVQEASANPITYRRL